MEVQDFEKEEKKLLEVDKVLTQNDLKWGQVDVGFFPTSHLSSTDLEVKGVPFLL